MRWNNFANSGGGNSSLYSSFSVRQTSPQLTYIPQTLNCFPRDLCLVVARHEKFKVMDLATYYLGLACQIWSRQPVFVDERPMLAGGSKSNSCSNWGVCQSKAELTQSPWKKPIRSTSRRRECPGYACPFNTADRQVHKANKCVSEHVYECVQNHATDMAVYAWAVHRRRHLKVQYVRIGHLVFSFSRQANRRQLITGRL